MSRLTLIWLKVQIQLSILDIKKTGWKTKKTCVSPIKNHLYVHRYQFFSFYPGAQFLTNMYLKIDPFIIKIDSIIWSAYVCHVCKMVYLIWVRKLTTDAVKKSKSWIGVRNVEQNKHQLLLLRSKIIKFLALLQCMIVRPERKSE